ncbi:hypothetical protein KIH74_24610 [Kineosporia sp. J2-2]|uniref:Lipoprotein n=1 Tax=Kineosporia corallincola TaxID=2835133 RepID=A0ABS5TQR7_9ACTN|nr:hypothetical protein [Kineosporia corallincola]MBT0772149.1 hypothetical protein [Kineosporia corallincola]
MRPLATPIAALALLLTACTTSESDAQPASESGPQQASESGPRQATACVTGDDLAASLNDPRVTRVEVLDDCARVSVATTLADDEPGLGLLVCEAAGERAYAAAPHVTRVAVLSENGSELAGGTRESDCTAG